MPKISIALILFTTLGLLAVSLWRRRGETAAATPFLAVAVLAAVQALLVSLRWDFGLAQFRIPQVLLAAAMPGAVWVAFHASASGALSLRKLNPLHALPVILAAIALSALPDAIDILLVLTFLFYGMRFLRLSLSGETGFGTIPLEGVINMRRAVWLLTFTLLGSTLVDVLVFLDFMHGTGAHAAQLIGAGNLVWLLALGTSVALGSSALPAEAGDADIEGPLLPAEEDLNVAASVRTLLAETGLAKDPGLTLSRLARRAGLPMRTVSGAINRVHGRNVSQYINDIRIAEACRLLLETDMSVTQSIYASGFQTKSNFNREFIRVTGKTPRNWRRQAAPNGA
jgi:AraC-like DNA-binding protein